MIEKIRFRDTFDRHELVKGQSNFYDSFPFHEGVGAETRANFLKEEVVSRGREAVDGRLWGWESGKAANERGEEREGEGWTNTTEMKMN